MGWKDTIQTIPEDQAQSKSSWRDTITDQAPTELESAGRGLAQGVSFGLRDEAAGALDSPLGALKEIANKFGGDFSDEDLEAYRKERDASRDMDKQAQTANPKSYLSGEIGGSLATALVPGMGALNVAKGATTGARVGRAALAGGTVGLGTSEAEDLQGLATDTAIGADVGGALQGIGEKAVAPALQKAGAAAKPYLEKAGQFISDKTDGLVDKGLQKLGKTVADVPESVTDRYLKNPASVNGALAREEVGESLLRDGGALEQLRQKVSQLDSYAWNELDTTPTFSKGQVIQVGQDYVDEILKGVKGQLTRTEGTGASNDMIKAIKGQLGEIFDAYGDKLSESDLKSVVQDLQKLAYSWEGSPKMSVAAEGLRNLSGRFNSVLKNSNQAYAAKMEPVAEATKLLKEVERNFINRQNPDSMDKFLGQLPRFANKSEQASAKVSLEGMDSLLGTSVKEDLTNTLAKEAFDRPATNGSRRTLMGALAGKAAGAALGSAAGYAVGDDYGAGIGAVAGFGADKYAGRIFKSFLDGKIAIDKLTPQVTKALASSLSH